MHSLNLAEVLVGAAKAGRAQEMLADLHAIGIHVAKVARQYHVAVAFPSR